MDKAAIIITHYKAGTHLSCIEFLCYVGFVRQEIPPGTLDLLILKVLSRRAPAHGFEIATHIQQLSADVLHVEEGSLYPALQRMLLKDWVKAEWGKTSENRRARYYDLTAAGRKQLAKETSRYGEVSAAIARVLKLA